MNSDEPSANDSQVQPTDDEVNRNAVVIERAKSVESEDIEMSDAEVNQNDEENEASVDDESSGEDDESYHGESDFESEDESVTNTVSYKEVPNAFQTYVAGPNAIEIEEKNAEALFDKSQECLRIWDSNPSDIAFKDAYFNTVHDLMLNSSFARMQRNPYTMDYASARRMEDRLHSNSIMKAFYATHFQLTKLVHNSIPHYLQMLAYTPSRTDLWYEMGGKAIELGDWKNAEFAYRKYMFFSGNRTKALQNIVLLHFVSSDFPKAINALKDLMNHQPNNTVAHVISWELSNIKGPWADHVDQVMIQSGVIKPRFALAQEKIDWVMSKVQKFRNSLKPKCRPCMKENAISCQQVQHLILEQRDILFYHFGNHLLKFYEEFIKSPNAIIFVMFPMREQMLEVIQVDPELVVDPSIEESSNADPSTSEPMEVELTDQVPRVPNVDEVNQAVPEITLTEDPVSEAIEEIPVPADSVPEATLHEEPLSELSKPRLVIQLSISGRYLQILDVLKQIADLNQMERSTKELYGFYGMASIFDQLLTFVVQNCIAEDFKRHRLDCAIFMKLYQKWHELTEYGLKFKSECMESIHLFALKVGSQDALPVLNNRLDKIVYKIIESSNESKLVDTVYKSTLRMDVDVDLESGRSSSPSYKRMVNMYSKMRKIQFDKNGTDVNKDQSTTQSTMQSTIESTTQSTTQSINGSSNTLRILSLYLSKPIININFDIRPLEYIEHMRFDTNFDVFSTSELTNLNEKNRFFLMSYHFMKAHHYRMSTAREEIAIKTDKIMEYRHLITLLKSVNHLFSSCKDFESSIQTWQQLVNNVEIKDLLSRIPSTIEELEDCIRRIITLCKGFKNTQIENLIIQFEQGEESDELVELLKNHEQFEVTAEKRLETLFILYKCHKGHNHTEKMFNALLIIMEKLLSVTNFKNDHFLTKLNDCLNEIDNNLIAFSSFPLDKLMTSFEQFTEKYQCKSISRLWITYYRVARRLDPETTEELCGLYQQMDAKECLPTKSLLILKKAHQVLAELKSCMKDEGLFLNFYLDELILISDSEMIKEAVEESGATVIWKNVTKELLSILNCVYNLQLPAKICKVHTHFEPAPVFPAFNWDVCERIMPLLLPTELPLYSDKEKLLTDLVEVLNKVQPLIESPLTDDLKSKFNQFVEDNKNYRPTFKLDPETAQFEMDTTNNGVTLTEWPYPQDLSLVRREISAQVLYLLTFKRFKDSSSGTKSDCLAVRDAAMKALMFGSDTLHPDLIASLWTLISIRTDYIFEDSDVELFKQMSTLLFPSYMAILFGKESAENHLELATNLYKIYTRFSRYLASKNQELREEIKIESSTLLTKAHTHFTIAKLHAKENFEIGWSSTYYLGKIAEKNNLPLEDVIEIYQKCALLMEEQFQFLKKVPRNDQSEFEQLELYYCIHSYLNKRRQAFLASYDLSGLCKVIRCLELFSAKNISRKPDEKTANFSIDIRSELAEVEQAVNTAQESDVPGSQTVLKKLEMLKKYNNDAEVLICHAFKEIMSLFPHYKAAFRLAQQHVEHEQYGDAVDLLFRDIFSIRGELNDKSSIFHGFVEIECSSFYYNRVLNYHLKKIIILLANCLEKTQDIKRLAVILISLLKVQQRIGKFKLEFEGDLIRTVLIKFAQLMVKINTANAPNFNVDTDPLYTMRPILFELDKQLNRTNNRFANDFHRAITEFQRRWNTLTTLPNH